MNNIRTRRRLALGAVLFLLASCGSGAEVSTTPKPVVASTQVAATSVPTSAPAPPVATAAPSPTPLTIEAVRAPIDEPEATAVVVAEPTVAVIQPSVALPVVPAPTAVAGSSAVLAANGAEVFTLNCARCHGENGLGSAQYSVSLVGVGSRFSSPGMVAELTNGHPVTFGFADRLSAEEIASVVAYVKSVWP